MEISKGCRSIQLKIRNQLILLSFVSWPVASTSDPRKPPWLCQILMRYTNEEIERITGSFWIWDKARHGSWLANAGCLPVLENRPNLLRISRRIYDTSWVDVLQMKIIISPSGLDDPDWESSAIFSWWSALDYRSTRTIPSTWYWWTFLYEPNSRFRTRHCRQGIADQFHDPSVASDADPFI